MTHKLFEQTDNAKLQNSLIAAMAMTTLSLPS